MSNKEYSKEQIQELVSNICVKDCTSKYISFTDEFKIKALNLNKKWLLPREIFKEFNFPEYIINTKIPKQTLATLRYKERNKWISWIMSSKKWRKTLDKANFDNMSLEKQNEYLKTEIAYLKELYKLKHWKYP